MANVKALMADAAKRFGKNGLFLLGDGEEMLLIERQSTGILTLDAMLGGGIPLGKIIQISGPEGAGKTSLSLQMSKKALEDFPDKLIVFIDAEGGNSYEFLADTYGLDLERTIYKRVMPEDSAQDVLDLLEWYASRPEIALVILDSYPCLVSDQDSNKDLKDGFRDDRPALISRCFRRLTRRPSNSCPVVIINQLRVNQNAQNNSDPWMEPGGMAMRHYPSLHLRIFAIGTVKDGEVVVGTKHKILSKKARFSIPRRSCEFHIDYEVGIDTARSLVDYAVVQEKIKKSGAWYLWGEEKYHGMNALLEVLRADKSLQTKLLESLDFSAAGCSEAE